MNFTDKRLLSGYLVGIGKVRAGGNALENGKFYQVTCVGSCWTLAEFTDTNAST